MTWPKFQGTDYREWNRRYEERQLEREAKRIAEAINQSVSYKHDWTVTAEAVGDAVKVTVTAVAPDSRNRKDLTRVSQMSRYPVKGRWEDGTIQATVRSQISLVESHETDEWLRWDGKCVTNPHPEVVANS
jgi:hypothetical protein